MKKAGPDRFTTHTRRWTWLGVLCGFLACAHSQVFAQAPGIATSGNTFVTTSSGTLGLHAVSANQKVVLRGVNETGSEYACLGNGKTNGSPTVWDSSSLPANTTDYQKVIGGMINTWHANVVRIPLNEDCWLGEPTSGQSTMVYGSNYITPIVNFVNAANAAGLVVEVNLQVGAGNQLVSAKSNDIDNFPAMDTIYSLQFWQSVATTFANNPAVIFNLTNEPEFLGSGSSEVSDWNCYVNGGCDTSVIVNECENVEGNPANQCGGPNGPTNTWNVQGVASVVSAIRSTEAANTTNGTSHVIIIAGVYYSNQLNDWLTYVPPSLSSMTNIAAGAHIYYDLACEDAACWSDQEGNILESDYPVVIDETGELTKGNGGDGCSGASTPTMVDWANAPTNSQGGSEPAVGYWFWAFNAFSCANGPGLLSSDSTFKAASGYGAAAFSALTTIQ